MNVGVKTEGPEPMLTVDSGENPTLSERDTLDDEPTEVDFEAGNAQNTGDDAVSGLVIHLSEHQRRTAPAFTTAKHRGAQMGYTTGQGNSRE